MIFVKTPVTSVAAKPQPIAAAQLSHIGGAGSRKPYWGVPSTPQPNPPRRV